MQEPSLSEEEIFLQKSLEQINKEKPLADVYFDYDKAIIRDDAKPVLDTNAAWLKKFKTIKILIEGHCDERGTEEYNLALGEKRAKAAHGLPACPWASPPTGSRSSPTARASPSIRGTTRAPGRRTGAPSSSSSRSKTLLRNILGAFFLAVLTLAAAGQDKSEEGLRADLRGRPGPQAAGPGAPRPDRRNTEEIGAIQEQLKALADLVRQSIAGQSGTQEGLRAVPAQYQDILRKLDQLTLALQKISADLAARPVPSPTAPAGAPEVEPKTVRASPDQAAGPGQAPAGPGPAAGGPEHVAVTRPTRMAYNDYLKGNYDLAVESFKLYRQQFPESPLADNALYWIGECHYSQRKFEEAIDAFDELILTYPQGDKAAAAHLKKGLSFIELGRKPEAWPRSSSSSPSIRSRKRPGSPRTRSGS